MSHYNFGVRGCNPTKLWHLTCLWVGVLRQVQLLGALPPLKIWEGKKRAKIGAIYDNFRVWAQISLEPMKIATKSKRRWREGSFRRWTKKICEIRSTTNKVI